MPEALALVKRELGPDAVILGTRQATGGGLGSLVGRAIVEITAAPGETASPAPRVRVQGSGFRVQDAQPPPTARNVEQPPPAASSARTASETRSRPPALPDALLPYYKHLVENEVAEALASQLVREVADAPTSSIQNPESQIQNPPDLLRAAIARRIPMTAGISLTPGTTRRVALIGPPGGGKTTTLAKLAAHFALRGKKSVAIVSLDTQRLGTHEQIRRYAELIGVPVFAAQADSQVRDVLRTVPSVDLLLIDTHGVSPRERGRFARLAALLRAAKPDETHLVLPASLAANIQDSVIRTFSPLGVSRIVLSKFDEVVGFGVVLNALERLGWERLSYVSDGQRVPTDLHEARGREVAELLIK